jgi:hypothetical protein
MALDTMQLTDLLSWTNAQAEVGIAWTTSVRLRALDMEVGRYLGLANRDGVDKVLYDIKVNDSTLWTSGRPLFAWLFGQLNRRNAFRPTTRSASGHFGTSVGDAINDLSQFACSDVLTWPGNIKGGQRHRVLMRYYLTDQVKVLSEAQANAGAVCLGKYSAFKLKSVHDLIQTAESACCTTFAMTGAHILISKGVTSRVELVAVPGVHCLIVVGRVGGLVSGKVPDASTWGGTAIVVDPWLGSLGHEAIFTNPSSYPYQNWLSNLEQNYDSSAVGVPFNPFANVKLRKVE